MSLEAFIPQIWSGEILSQLRKAHVFGFVANRNFQGDISAFGDTVKINMIGNITVSDYTKNSTSMTPQILDDASKFLRIDKAKYFNFRVDKVDQAQAKPSVMAEAMARAAYGLRDESDTDIAALYTDAQIVSGLGTAALAIAITSVNVTEYVSLVASKLDEANVPQESRWMVIAPWFRHKLELADITLNTDNTSTITNGFFRNFLGFNLFVSNNVSIGTPATNTHTRIMAGYNGTITLAEQLLEVEAFKPEASFGDAVKGLYVYGIKTVRPETLACLDCTYTAEP